MKLFSIAFSLFLLMNPIGNVPFYLSLLAAQEAKRRPWIILREMLIALFAIILFYFIGENLLSFLHIRMDAIKISGAIILFLISLKMIFPNHEHDLQDLKKIEDPFIVPLAIPLIAGPAVLAAVMIYSRQDFSILLMLGAILLSWGASLIILIFSSVLAKKLGERGIVAIQRLMGLILVLLSVEMFLDGIANFLQILALR